MMYKKRKVFRNGLITTSEKPFVGDIALENGFISEVGHSISGCFDSEINLEKRRILPGCIDPHVHFGLLVNGLQSRDDFVTGSRKALRGGVTTVIDFSNIDANQLLPELVIQRYREARSAECSVFLHAAVRGWSFLQEKEAETCLELGVRSFKFFTAYEESGRRTGYDAIERAASWAAKNDARIIVHAEDQSLLKEADAFVSDSFVHYEDSRPVEAEVEAIKKLGAIQMKTGASMAIVHVSSGSGVDAAMQTSLKLETCPHYLTLTKDVYQTPAGRHYAVAPPLRSIAEQNLLWKAVTEGRIAWIGSDHAPFPRKMIEMAGDHFYRVPFGLSGVGKLLPVMIYEGVKKGRITWEQLVALTSENAAKFYGLYPQKGCITEGSDADLIAVDESGSIEVLSCAQKHLL